MEDGRAAFSRGVKKGSQLREAGRTLGGGSDHSQLEGVADGQMAVDAYLEATEPDTPTPRKEELRQQLLTYCRLDTWAMVRLWAFLVGRPAVGEGEASQAPSGAMP